MPPALFTAPDHRFEHVHVDLVGPMEESEGYKYCMTMVDRYTRWVEAVPIADMTAETVAYCFYTNWIPRFGTPKFITTDQGSQFESQLFNALAKLLGGKRIRTTAYNPQGNGLVERWHRCLKNAIRCHGRSRKWTKVMILLGLRTAYKEDLKASAAEFLYGAPLIIPGEFFLAEDTPDDHTFFYNEFREHMRNVRPVHASHHYEPKVFAFKDLASCSHFF